MGINNDDKKITCDNPNCDNKLTKFTNYYQDDVKSIIDKNWSLFNEFVLCPKCQDLKQKKCTFSQHIVISSYELDVDKRICGKNPEIKCNGSKLEKDNCPEWRKQ